MTSAVPRPWEDPAATPFVRVEGVTKRFGSFTAVQDVSLDIYRGELFCLLGGSGCGKSTLLRMLAGFEDVSAGRVIIDGRDQTGVPPYLRDTNMMFQSYALFPHLSVEKNIAYGLRREGLPRAEIATRVTDMLSLVQMQGFAARRPHQLSGGQRQRVALARALVKRPKLLLLDEPLGALDRKLREETQLELIKIQQSLGITFIVVTHDQEEAMTLSTRLGVMTEGRIVQTGTPHEIYEFPRSRFVADFIGSVNLFDGRIAVDGTDSATIACPGAGMDIHISHSVAGTVGQAVTVAIRPEKIEMLASPSGTRPNAVEGRVEEVAYMGNLSVYHVRLDSGMIVRVNMSNRSRYDDDVPRPGASVVLEWDGSAGVVLEG
ncbi:polyamine ABC transporter ATP-binding protein [Brevirhabdus pacifica]|uniref:Spermidine/putrescine import ATP-binding protein PotA n=1 Tax=Brevirhabdus pacifica TaxID=1267768 RepID=A0A1U7DMC0_9RHOB|nr:polyamine ABC transporter ATP-binding protein [Brevirhabdus pacifica]OWU76893.1 ABC transporter ATP-binding protein [Loktanella sp. 22II-4b]